MGQPEIRNTILNFGGIRGAIKDLDRNVIQGQCAVGVRFNGVSTLYQSRVHNGKIYENITHSWHNHTTEYWSDGQRLDLVPSATSEQHLENLDFPVPFLAIYDLSSWLAEKSTSSNKSQAVEVQDGHLSFGPDDLVNSSSSSAYMLRVSRDSDVPRLFGKVAKSMARNIRSVTQVNKQCLMVLIGRTQLPKSVLLTVPRRLSKSTPLVHWPRLKFSASDDNPACCYGGRQQGVTSLPGIVPPTNTVAGT